MAISKKTREQVYAKYNGHCAYCGSELKYKDMQVDHMIPVCRGNEDWYNVRGTDDISNLMPSCRMCNYYKGMSTPDCFRTRLRETLDYKHTFATKMALRYGMLSEHKWDNKFYYEKQ